MSDEHNSAVCVRPRCPYVPIGDHGMCTKHREAWVKANYPNGYLVDAAPVAIHIARLRAAGLSWATIAERTNGACTSWAIRDIVEGRRAAHRVVATTADAVLAIPVPDRSTLIDMVPDGRSVPMLGSTRRAQALVAIGYTNKAIALGIGYPLEQFHRIVSGDHRWITARVHRSMVAFYEHHETRPAPDSTGARRAIRRAAGRGWPPPVRWIGVDIDDPAAVADPGPDVIRFGKGGNLIDEATFVELITDHREVGHNDDQIAAAFGITVDALQARYRKAGIPFGRRWRDIEDHREASASPITKAELATRRRAS